MTYTAEQLRRDAIAIERMHGETLTVEWRDHQAGLLRAFAAALEENARLTRECEFHAKQCARVDELRHRAEAELAKLKSEMASLEQALTDPENQPSQFGTVTLEWHEAELAKLRQLVAQQAEDDGLWFNAATAPEAYLQQELRKLHAAVEGTK